MKNNRLHIVYGAEEMQSMPQGTIESLRTTSIESAERILKHRNKYFVKSATFKSSQGIIVNLR